MAAELTAHELTAQHRPSLDQALEDNAHARVLATRTPAPEGLRTAGRHGQGQGRLDALLGSRLDLGQPGTDWVGGEISPYGIELGVTYPHADVDVLLPRHAGRTAGLARRGRGDARDGLLEILKRIADRARVRARGHAHQRPGLRPTMAFQAGSPHAQDRGLEAVAYAYVEQVRTPTPDRPSPRASATRSR